MSSFCVYVIFSETITDRGMKLGSCIHLEELRSILCSILSHVSLTYVEILRLCHFLRNYEARAMKIVCIHLEE